ncbi:MAG: hypothetical protein Tsb0016_09200 [Sphingomonadales bacterium]
MATFVMLTRMHPQNGRAPETMERLESDAVDRIKRSCRDIEWLSNYAVGGPYEYLDIFSAPDTDEAMKVASIIRMVGDADVELWPAETWTRYKSLVREANA